MHILQHTIVCTLSWLAEGRYPYDIMTNFFSLLIGKLTYGEVVQRTDRYGMRWGPPLSVYRCQIGLGQLTVPLMRERARTNDSSTQDRFALSRRRKLVSLSLRDAEHFSRRVLEETLPADETMVLILKKEKGQTEAGNRDTLLLDRGSWKSNDKRVNQ